MSNKKMGVLESRFADFIWNNEPVTSGQLVKMAEKELSWKSTTSYTVLKRLCERGIFQNKDGAVTSLISREEFYALQSEQFVEETFDGSLPAFLAAFGTRKKMTEACEGDGGTCTCKINKLIVYTYTAKNCAQNHKGDKNSSRCKFCFVN